MSTRQAHADGLTQGMKVYNSASAMMQSQSFYTFATVRVLLLVVCIYRSHSAFTAVTAHLQQSQRNYSSQAAFTANLQQSQPVYSGHSALTAHSQGIHTSHSVKAMQELPVYESSDVSL